MKKLLNWLDVSVSGLIALILCGVLLGALFLGTSAAIGRSIGEKMTEAHAAEAETVVHTVVHEVSYVPVTYSEDILTPEDIPSLEGYEKAAAMMAQTVYGEANGLSLYERSMVCWCILNRVDDNGWGNSIEEVITAPNQFHGYSPSKPCTDENYRLACDVIMRWLMEGRTMGDVGRTLPKEYIGFYGKNGHNHFRNRNKEVYDMTSANPYI